MGTPIVRGPLKLQPSPGYSIDIDTRGFKTTVANLVGRNGKDFPRNVKEKLSKLKEWKLGKRGELRIGNRNSVHCGNASKFGQRFIDPFVFS